MKIVLFQKISIPTSRKADENSKGVGFFQKPKFFNKKKYEAKLKFSKEPFVEGGYIFFWNNTLIRLHIPI